MYELFKDGQLIIEGNLDTYDINRLELYSDGKFHYVCGGGQSVDDNINGTYTIENNILTLKCLDFVNYGDIDPNTNNHLVEEFNKTYICPFKLIREKIKHVIGYQYVVTHYTIKFNKNSFFSKEYMYLTQYNTFEHISEYERQLYLHNRNRDYIIKYTNYDKNLLIKNLDENVLKLFIELTRKIYLENTDLDTEPILDIHHNLEYYTLLGYSDNYIYISYDSITNIILNDNYVIITYCRDDKPNFPYKTSIKLNYDDVKILDILAPNTDVEDIKKQLDLLYDYYLRLNKMIKYTIDYPSLVKKQYKNK